MLQKMTEGWFASWRRWALLSCTLLLAGCASTISARVTSYQQWPAGVAGQTYRLVPGPTQTNNLEFDTYADMIRAAIGPTGLVEAIKNQPARFDVTFTYGNPVTQTWVQQYADPPFYNGFGPGWGGYYGPYNRGWGGGVYFGPSIVNVPVQVYKNSLTVSIKDRHNHGAEVYRSSAVNFSGGDNLLPVMPYLARAVFDGFPGNNGQVREIRYERNPR
ncbi:DUF4136 domain-containing protein [Paralcaligenes sp. KSB-10]|uniref:DUF4136 domain-containing protein n=1 Tax=Paralcaligenes sp. KSB-10 TaxID=2901142 RepID=UPI001E62BEA3|nr:DUF4136 domain-containing protein [Paralcaligenes sp. KSB-10]UHL64375.1 DUF4136 domain-containing protein [Paralcaligenes sp. KSB-10]